MTVMVWLRRFEAFCKSKNLTDAKTKNPLRSTLTGPAADWSDNIDFTDDSTTFKNCKEAFCYDINHLILNMLLMRLHF